LTSTLRGDDAIMDLIPDKRPVARLVEQAHEASLCLPNFQRDFVWPRDQVADLIRSILRGYYIGSLLLLRCDPLKPPFSPLLRDVHVAIVTKASAKQLAASTLPAA